MSFIKWQAWLALGLVLIATNLVVAQGVMNGPPPLGAVHLNVVDEATGKPVQNVTVCQMAVLDMREQPLPIWDTVRSFRNGLGVDFPFQRNGFGGGRQCAVRVAAPGYVSVDSQPLMSAQLHTIEIRMKPGPLRRVSVKDADGKPLAGASVAIAPAGKRNAIVLQNGKLKPGYEASVVSQTDEAGVVEFTPLGDQFGGVVVGTDGYAIFDTFEKPQELTSKKWSSLELNIEAAEPNMRLTVEVQGPRPWITCTSSGSITADGANRFDGLVEGQAMLIRNWTANRMPGAMPATYRISVMGIPLAAGQQLKKQITIPAGRIRGKFKLPDEFPADAKFNESGFRGNPADRLWITINAQGSIWKSRAEPVFPMPPDIATWDDQRIADYKTNWKTADSGKAFLAALEKLGEATEGAGSFQTEADGSFNVENVPPGKYVVQAFVAVIKTTGTEMMTAHQVVDVVEGQDISLDELKIGKPASLQLGIAAPAIDCPLLSGVGRFKLADHRGKVVLVNFWRSASSDNLSDMLELQQAHELYAPGGKFAAVSLSQDSYPISAYVLVRERGFKWLQGFVGRGSNCSAIMDYNTTYASGFFLIDPEGRIAACGKSYADVSEKLDALMKEVK